MFHLLIVDDQSDLVDDLAEMLPWDSVGIGTVHKAYSAPEALEIVMANPIDVVITDIRMPGMSGLDLIERIRASWKKIRCILLTGYDDFEYARRALQNQANNYLLKPADDRELLDAVARAVKEIEEEWKEISSLRNALHSVKKNLPVLRSHLLTHLLEGRRVEDFREKMELFELPISENKPVFLMLIRLENEISRRAGADSSLMEYAAGNMAEELFGEDFYMWSCNDPYGYLVFLLQEKQRLPVSQREKWDPEGIERKAAQLQHYVKLYLKHTVSVLISPNGAFPGDVAPLYEKSIAAFRRQIGSRRDFLLFAANQHEGEAGPEAGVRNPHALKTLYEPPLIVHLLESGQWEALREKVQTIFAEVEQQWNHSLEHIMEIYYAIVSALSYFAHKNRRWLMDLLGDDMDRTSFPATFQTAAELRDWTERALDRLKQSMEMEDQDKRSGLVRRVQNYIQQHLGEATLQRVAEQVALNPTYLSKLYKLETGEGISDYLYRMKMERAGYLLQHTNKKIYEIAASLGYSKTSYFIKVFKEKYGMTPQEYRDRLM